MFKYFIIIVLLFITFLQALVHWCAYESCFVVLVQASTISLACVSAWTVTDYLFSAGWRLFKHLLSANESGGVHCSFHYLISLLFELTLNKFTFHKNNDFQYFINIDTKFFLVVNFRSDWDTHTTARHKGQSSFKTRCSLQRF